jgi:hypothetical protein
MRRSIIVPVVGLACAFILAAGSAPEASLGRPPEADSTRRSLSYPPASIERGASFRSDLTAANLGTRTARRSAPRLRPVDGGLRYYSRFSNALPSRPSYFPIGVWLACAATQGAVRRDKDAGLNLYVGICGNANEWPHVVRGGMRVFPQSELLSRGVTFGAETAGWMNSDELDMAQGPSGCRTVKNRNNLFPADGRLRYANFGKGVAVWQTDAQAACFLNAVDVPSTDVYWFSDDNICGAGEAGDEPGVVKANSCHVAANYGWLVNRERSLIQPARSKPVWAFVEVGCPFGPDWPCITPPQIRAAVWQSLIAGARGIIYFNHSFSGPCVTNNALRDPCYAAMRAMVKSVNKQIKSLAPVLNAPFVTSRWRHSPATKAIVKWHGGHFYVFAGSAKNVASTGSFSIPCVGNATARVVGEKRKIPVRRGSFRDSFADGNAVHIYRIGGGSACGLNRRP